MLGVSDGDCEDDDGENDCGDEEETVSRYNGWVESGGQITLGSDVLCGELGMKMRDTAKVIR